MQAGQNQTARLNTLIIDAIGRANAAAELTDSLMVGYMSGTLANQWIQFNVRPTGRELIPPRRAAPPRSRFTTTRRTSTSTAGTARRGSSSTIESRRVGSAKPQAAKISESPHFQIPKSPNPQIPKSPNPSSPNLLISLNLSQIP